MIMILVLNQIYLKQQRVQYKFQFNFIQLTIQNIILPLKMVEIHYLQKHLLNYQGFLYKYILKLNSIIKIRQPNSTIIDQKLCYKSNCIEVNLVSNSMNNEKQYKKLLQFTQELESEEIRLINCDRQDKEHSKFIYQKIGIQMKTCQQGIKKIAALKAKLLKDAQLQLNYIEVKIDKLQKYKLPKLKLPPNKIYQYQISKQLIAVNKIPVITNYLKEIEQKANQITSQLQNQVKQASMLFQFQQSKLKTLIQTDYPQDIFIKRLS